MYAEITTGLFYLFAALLTAAAVGAVTARNPVFSVFYLIFAFFNAAGLFVLIGAEYLAMTLVVVYVGAVAVLFLFVVMMLNINAEKARASFAKYLPLGLLITFILFVELAVLIWTSFMEPMALAPAGLPTPDVAQVQNTQAIGAVLYTRFALLFQLSGLVLLVAMIGAIVLTHRHRPGVKRQRIAKQNARRRAEAVALVRVKPGEGI